jgi:hypothetical protein
MSRIENKDKSCPLLVYKKSTRKKRERKKYNYERGIGKKELKLSALVRLLSNKK